MRKWVMVTFGLTITVALFSAVHAARATADQAFQNTQIGTTGGADRRNAVGFDAEIRRNSDRMLEEGRRIFRSDTFGDEAFKEISPSAFHEFLRLLFWDVPAKNCFA